MEQNGVEAEKWLRRAADQGHEQAQALLSTPMEELPEEQEPLGRDTLPKWCLRAEDGDAQAQYQVAAFFLEQGLEVERRDAERYLVMASKQGHPEASLMLARQRFGQNRAAEAVELLRNAADCGHLWKAAELLGICYGREYGTQRNMQQAERWLIRAAERGGGEQMLKLALCYAQGDCVPMSQARAYSWVQKAQENGCPDARARFEEQYNRYIQEQKRQAEAEQARRLEEEQRRAQEEAERQAREQAEQKRRAEEAAREAAQQAAREKQQQEEQAKRQAEQAQRQAEQARRQAEQAQQMEERQTQVQQTVYGIGVVMLAYVAVGALCQVIQLRDIQLPWLLWRPLELLLLGNKAMMFKSLLGICAAGWYLLAHNNRRPANLGVIGGGLLAIQVFLTLAEWLENETSLFGIIIVLIFFGIPYLVWNLVLFFGLLVVAGAVLSKVFGVRLPWLTWENLWKTLRNWFKSL